ncbi:MAG TPA: tetratricopeptide repeat protein, partial [Capsulimonadaceae bacterium]|nr:tetratricopeptide repeat protein [Capsulimonadaceae bacterium]
AKADAARPRRWIYFGLATAAYAVALLCKPLSVCVPIMALVLELLLFRRPLRSFRWPLAGWFAAALLLGAWTHHIHIVPPVVSTALWQRPFLAGDSLAFYLVKLFLPWPMAYIYGRSADMVLHHWWGYCTWLLPALVGVLAWKLYRRFPELATGYGLMIAGTLPMLGFLQYQMEQWSDVTDRYMYLAMVGPALVLAALATRLRRPALAGIYALLLVACVFSFRQLSFWRSSDALYRHSIAVFPGDAGVHMLLGDALWDEGNEPDAIAQFCTAARLAPSDGIRSFVAANALLAAGRKEEAIPYFEQAIKDDPSGAGSYFGLGLIYAESGQAANAVVQWQAAARLAPSNPDYHYNLGLALLRLSRYEEAADQFRIVLVLQPGSPTAQYRLSQALLAEQKSKR